MLPPSPNIMLDDRRMLLKFSAYGFLKNLRFFEPFLYLFFLASGLSYLEIGTLISIREISVLLLEIPTGVVADLTGRRRAMAGAFAAYITSFSIFYLFHRFVFFVPAMLLFAAGEAFRSGTHKSMIMTHLDAEGMADRKVAYYGTTRSASRLGSAVSALLAGVIVYLWQDYHVVFAVTIVPYLLGLLLMLTYPRELDGELSVRPLSDLGSHMAGSIRQLVHRPGLLRMVINASIYDSFFKISKDYLSPIVELFAVSLPALLFIGAATQRTAILVGVVYFFVYLNSFVFSRKAAPLMQWVGNLPQALNILFFVLGGAFLVAALFLYLDILLLSIAAVFFFFSLYNLRKPMVVGYLGDRIAPQQRATLLSTHNQLRSVAGMVIAPVLGFFADRYGISAAFAFGAVVLLIAGGVLYIRDD